MICWGAYHSRKHDSTELSIFTFCWQQLYGVTPRSQHPHAHCMTHQHDQDYGRRVATLRAKRNIYHGRLPSTPRAEHAGLCFRPAVQGHNEQQVMGGSAVKSASVSIRYHPGAPQKQRLDIDRRGNDWLIPVLPNKMPALWSCCQAVSRCPIRQQPIRPSG